MAVAVVAVEVGVRVRRHIGVEMVQEQAVPLLSEVADQVRKYPWQPAWLQRLSAG